MAQGADQPGQRDISFETRLWLWLLAPLGAFSLIVIPAIVSGRGGPSEAGDEVAFHLPVIRQMMRNWPTPDVANYEAVMTPGYHYLMAALGVAAGPDNPALGEALMHAATALLSAAMLAFLYIACAPRLGPARAGLASLALALNPYFLGSSIYLATDNAALLFVTAALVVGPLRGGRPAATLTAGLLATAAVLTRQIFLWTTAPIGVAAALASPAAALAPRWLRIGDPERRSWSSFAAGVVAAVVPIGVVGIFVWVWGGLTPQSYRGKHDAGFNFAAYSVGLSLLGIYGLALAVSIGALTWRRALAERRWIAVGASIGALAALLPPTAYEPRIRATGWWWRLVQLGPELAERSLIALLGCALGGAIVALLLRRAVLLGRGPIAGVMAVAIVAWLTAQSANTMAWLRYFEPMSLVMSILLAALACCDEASRVRPIRRIGPLAALALFQATITALTLGREILGAAG